MADGKEIIPTQEGEAASAPLHPEDLNAAISHFMGGGSAPEDLSSAADADAGKPGQSAEQDPAPSLEDAAQAQPAGSTPPARETPNDDIWSRVDPEVRAAHEQALRDADLRIKGIQGRQSASDKALREARGRLAELEARGGQQPDAAQERQGDGTQAGTDRETALNALREEYPEIAEPLLAEIAEMREQLASFQQPIGDLQAREQAALEEQQVHVVTSKHPDWEVIRTDERLYGWAQAQPRAVQEAMMRNGEGGIVDGHEVAWVVDLFKRDMGIGVQSAPDPRLDPAPQNQRRERQLAAGRDASGGSGPSVATGIPKDFNAAVSHFMKQSAATG